MQRNETKKTPNQVDALFCLGAALISVGLGLLTCWAAGLISLGVFSLTAAWMSDVPDGGGGDQ